jgi:hypothetical protein
MKNKAKCKNCGDILESKHRHDWVACSCFKNAPDNKGIFIDGGNEYLRGGGAFENMICFDEDDNELHVKVENGRISYVKSE